MRSIPRVLDNGVAKALGFVFAIILFGVAIGFAVVILKDFLNWF